MNFESVSVESPRLDPSQASSPGELKRNAAFGDDYRAASEPGVFEGLLKQVMIEIALEKIAAHGFCGGEHVWQFKNGLGQRDGIVLRLGPPVTFEGHQVLWSNQ